MRDFALSLLCVKMARIIEKNIVTRANLRPRWCAAREKIGKIVTKL